MARNTKSKSNVDTNDKQTVASGPSAESKLNRGAKAHRDPKQLKPGSNIEDAKAVGGKGDFGAHESDAAEREYASRAARNQDKGAQPREAGHPTPGDGNRTSGVGMPAGGVGSASGGDLDSDIVGVGTGGSGVASTDKVHHDGPDDSDGSSDEFASGGHAKRENQSGVGAKAYKTTIDEVKGRVNDRADDASTGQDERGADAVRTNDLEDDGSFAGEISSSEADGRDNRGE
ncbi:MAG: hypothetical protein QM770_18745 [Tepidisphaeraceae bacterium]